MDNLVVITELSKEHTSLDEVTMSLLSNELQKFLIRNKLDKINFNQIQLIEGNYYEHDRSLINELRGYYLDVPWDCFKKIYYLNNSNEIFSLVKISNSRDATIYNEHFYNFPKFDVEYDKNCKFDKVGNLTIEYNDDKIINQYKYTYHKNGQLKNIKQLFKISEKKSEWLDILNIPEIL